jgi:hypothetical protein
LGKPNKSAILNNQHSKLIPYSKNLAMDQHGSPQNQKLSKDPLSWASTKDKSSQPPTHTPPTICNPAQPIQPLAKAKPDEQRKFILLRSLGEGSFGKVKEAMHVLTKEKLAVKILEKARIKKTEDLIRVKREIHILSKLNHPNLIQLYEVIETKCYYFLIMEYARHGELSKYIRKMVR